MSRGNAPAFRLRAKQVLSLAIQCGGSSPLTGLPRKRDIASEEGAIWPFILWEGGKERGPKNEEEEEEIGDGQSTAALMPGYKMSHLLAITVVAYEKCSGVTQVRTLHQQTRLRAVLEPLRTALTSTMLSYLPCNPN